jgi:lipopolysaccharide biosynthesis glycosyltransferase
LQPDPIPTPQRVAVCLASDAGYALPSAVVAASVARMASPRIGPVYFVWADDAAPPAELAAFLDQAGVRLARVPERLLAPFAGARAGPLTRGALGRLFLAQALEREAIGRFLYLDGDIEVTGSLDALAEIPLAAGQVAAVDDVRGVIFTKPHLAEQLRAERRRLGLPDSVSYFNSGVMLADMRDWPLLAARALEFYLSDPGACIFLDQCALNAVCHDRRLVLSPRWNFQSPLLDLGLEALLQPHIVHFNGTPKPWMPIAFTRSWQARKPFQAARPRMPQLWKITEPRIRPARYYTVPIKKRIRALKGRKLEKARREFSEYLERTKFVDDWARGTPGT